MQMREPIFTIKLASQENQTLPWKRGYFWCPGCNMLHAVNIGADQPPNQPTWEFFGSEESPTLDPDVTVTMGIPKDPEDPQTELFNKICHSKIREGKIQFEADCTAHDRANQILPLPPLPEWFLREA